MNVGTVSVGEWNKITARIDFTHATLSGFDRRKIPLRNEMHFATNSTENISELDWVGFAKTEDGPGAASFDNITVNCPSPAGGARARRTLSKAFGFRSNGGPGG